MKKFRFIQTPKIVEVINGRHKGFIGEVWSFTEDKYELVTDNGWYITTLKENTQTIQLQRKRIATKEYMDSFIPGKTGEIPDGL
jgi:hypothetical protein